MKHEEAIELVKKKLPERRFQHTMGVYEAALALSEHYGENCKKVGLAAILHDYAKGMDQESMMLLIQASKYPNKILKWNPVVWHGFVAAYLMKEKYKINDQDVLDAIAYHTTGHKSMNDLAKIVYLADMTEKGRDFPGVEDIRKLSFENLDEAMLFAVKITLQHLLENEETIAPYTIGLYNALLNLKKD